MKIKITLTTILLLFTVVVIAQPCANNANVFNFTYQGKSYDVVKEVKNWSNASACAVQRGGYLVQINSQGEQDTVFATIMGAAGISSAYASVADGGGIAYVWIGGTDRHAEGTWLWDGNYDNAGANFWTGQGSAGAGNGAAVNSCYVNWGGTATGTAAEPDDYLGIQDCGAIGLNTWPNGIAGEWNDISGLNNLYYVIEYDTLLGVDELKNNFTSNVFPNPANEIVSITSSNPINQIDELKLFNQLGELVVSQDNLHSASAELNVSDYAQDIYFLHITFSNGLMETRKISVVH